MVPLRRVRQRSSYREFRDLLAVIRNGDVEKTMTHVYNMIDSHRGYHYAWISCAAHDSLRVLFDELAIEKAGDNPLLLVNRKFARPEIRKMVEEKLKEGRNGVLHT